MKYAKFHVVISCISKNGLFVFKIYVNNVEQQAHVLYEKSLRTYSVSSYKDYDKACNACFFGSQCIIHYCVYVYITASNTHR